MNVLDPKQTFDCVVSVEMFEYMMNWRELMTRVRSWLKPDGQFFMHIFTHRSGAYLFDRADKEDWIAQHFFTGGVMPSHHLIPAICRSFRGGKGMALERRTLSAHRARLG